MSTTPGFTAASSLYRSTGRYGAFSTEDGTARDVVAASYPGRDTMRGCYTCLEKDCPKHLAICQILADVSCFLNPFVCLGLHGGCWLEYGTCLATCHLPGDLGECCPTPCGIPDPLHPGVGCCDHGERCVDERDPNARNGCCPSGQHVCSGKCCRPGENCCGGACCPEHYFCLDGFCSQYMAPLFPSDTKVPERPSSPFSYCLAGHTPCNGKCCEPGLECCPDGHCKWTCVH
jgi:hypothetical protein